MSRTVMLWLAAGNVSLAVGVYLVGHAQWGVAAALSMSDFHDLTARHAVQIDTEALTRTTNGRMSEETDIPLSISEGFRDSLTVLNVAAVGLLLDAMIWLYAAWRTPRTTIARGQIVTGRRLFTLASVLSLGLCLWSAFVAVSFWANWKHGAIASDAQGAPVVHFPADLTVARAWAAIGAGASILPLLWFIRFAHQRISEPRDEKLVSVSRCPSCGYDLRATPGRCPECGAVPAEARP